MWTSCFLLTLRVCKVLEIIGRGIWFHVEPDDRNSTEPDDPGFGLLHIQRLNEMQRSFHVERKNCRLETLRENRRRGKIEKRQARPSVSRVEETD